MICAQAHLMGLSLRHRNKSKVKLNRRRRWEAVLCTAVGASFAQTADAQQQFFAEWPAALQTDVERITRRSAAELSLYVKDLTTGAKYTHNASTPTYLASGIKVPVMMAVFRQLEKGELSMDAEVLYGPKAIRDGSPQLNLVEPRSKIAVSTLLEVMIQHSDNAAADMLINLVGLNAVNLGLVEEGIHGFGPITTLLEVRRLVYRNIDPDTEGLRVSDFFELGVTRPLDLRLLRLSELLEVEAGTFQPEHYQKGFQTYYRAGYNTAPLEAMGTLLGKLAKGEIVNPQRSQQMIEIMLGTKTGAHRFISGLPPNTPFAHKTGTQYRRICDFGVFYMKDDRPIVLAGCIKGGRTRKAAEEELSQVASRVYYHLSPPNSRSRLKNLRRSRTRAKPLAYSDGQFLAPGLRQFKKRGVRKFKRRPKR